MRSLAVTDMLMLVDLFLWHNNRLDDIIMLGAHVVPL
jgi:hypothetical protein